jgi:signal transduction histidine kinase
LLDTLALQGEVVDATITSGEHSWHSDLLPHAPSRPASQDDYAFGTNDDDAYYVSTQLTLRDKPATLRIGFDERPTREGIERTRTAVLAALGLYAFFVMAMGWFLSRFLARPLRELQASSRRVAMGDLSHNLDTTSRIREFRGLANDLETMRRELVGLNRNLENQIAERAVLESRIRQKQRLETVGTLAGGVAHELNNVLVPIRLYSDMALDSIHADHPAHEDLVQLRAAVGRAGEIVSHVLVFSSRLEGQSLQPLDIAPAVEEGIRLFAALRPASIDISSRIASPTHRVLADHTLVVQVVLNLCTNAYHAMRDDGGSLQVELVEIAHASTGTNAVDSGTAIQLTVTDTGHGMDTATKDRMFEPYFTTRPVGEGTGLGLSLVHGIVTAMNGTITVESEPGRGTRITIILPAIDAISTKGH